MGKRGPKQTSIEVLEKRGSWLAKARKKAETIARQPDIAREIPNPVRIRNWRQLLTSIPGYDPYAGTDDYYFDCKSARHAIDWIQQNLIHIKGEKAGQPFILESWQRAIIANLFGWKHKSTHLRRYRIAFIEIGRKNGKTPLAAAIILYMLFEDGEPGAEIYGAASEYKQASLVFTHAWGMRNRNPMLKERSRVFRGQSKAIEVGEPGDIDYGIYRVISSDSLAAHGFNTHCGVVDELHTQPNSELVDALETSTGARREPLIVYITTSDFERESICNEKEDYAKSVRDGIINDPSFLPVIYEASIDDDWTLESTWRKANPNLGGSITKRYLRDACKKAQELVRYENTFKRLHLNIRTQQDVRWISLDLWDSCNGMVNEGELIGCRCFMGFDLSSNTDITARSLLFPPDSQCGLWRVLWRFYVPKDNAHERELKDHVPYMVWGEQGYITLIPGNVVDYAVIKADFEQDCEKFDVEGVAFDRWNFEGLRQQFITDGIPEDKFISFGQGYASMSAPTKRLETILLQGLLAHNANPVARWMATNVAIEEDAAGNIKPSKRRSKEKIDGIVALVMALGQAMAGSVHESIYEKRGPLVFDV